MTLKSKEGKHEIDVGDAGGTVVADCGRAVLVRKSKLLGDAHVPLFNGDEVIINFACPELLLHVFLLPIA